MDVMPGQTPASKTINYNYLTLPPTVSMLQ